MMKLAIFSSVLAFASQVLACPDLSGRFRYQDSQVGEVINHIEQPSCELLKLTTTRKSPEGDEFEIQTEFRTDGILRRTTDEAPYAQYEVAEHVNGATRIRRLDVMIRRGLMRQNLDETVLQILPNGNLKIVRTMRDDHSQVTLRQEREVTRIPSP